MIKHLPDHYTKTFTLFIVILLFSRIAETLTIALIFENQQALFLNEGAGLLIDILATTLAFSIIYPFYYFAYKTSPKITTSIFIFFILLLSLAHFLITSYFIYQLIPLDTFLYQYSFKEILFTINTADSNIAIQIIGLICFSILVWLTYSKTHKLLSKVKTKHLYISTAFSIVALIIIVKVFTPFQNNFMMNKSAYFYSRSIKYFASGGKETELTTKDAIAYQKLFSDRNYLNTNYPLLHDFNSSDALSAHYRKFDTAPNIVVIIVEGLADDFIHPYKGVKLMPFLNNLKDSCLYWNKCFTLGERSFAAVPCITGGLPYAEKGFMLLDVLPKHYTLVNILKHNNYHSTFFYGQGSWFHRKGRFFNYNNIDVVFDKDCFDNSYEKIIVGNNNFFWGYNDKDLFEQSLEVIDTLTKRRRFDIYFTGTSHSPFAISDEAFYSNRLNELSRLLQSPEDIEFFDTYSKQLKALLFVDDAIKEFIDSYKKRPEYTNTLFIITGDHPMTEIPITNSIKRYHVPLLFYSAQTKQAHTFTNIVSHSDIYETILAFLKSYDLDIPSTSASIGRNLIPQNKEYDRKIAFMNDNRELVDYYSNGYFLSNSNLYKVHSNLSLTPISNVDLYNKVTEELNIFKRISAGACLTKRIVPKSDYFEFFGNETILSNSVQTPTVSSNRYQSLLKTSYVRNNEFIFDISFAHQINNTENISVVYQLQTVNDSTIFWKNAGIGSKYNVFQTKKNIPRHNVSDSVLVFKTYIWNKDEKKISISNLDVDLYYTK